MGNLLNVQVSKKSKVDVDADPDDDNEQECVVNETDYRKPVHDVASIRDHQIIKCIGQIEAEYKYRAQHKYKGIGYGTGTVYKVINGYAFIVTCGHNIRNQIKYCSKCDTYNNLSKKCSNCIQKCASKKVIKPTAIQFHRRSIKPTDFGHIQQTYQCRELYVPRAYIPLITKQKTLFGESGFDFAILMFQDDEYYAKNCRDIAIDVGFDVLQQNKRFCIFGYPGPDPRHKYPNVKPHKLYGSAMVSDYEENAIEFKPCRESYDEFKRETEYTIRQQEVDSSPGQSGCAVFVERKDEAVICGVHIEGHVKKVDVKEDYSYNRATLLSSNYIRIMTEINDSAYEEKAIDAQISKTYAQELFAEMHYYFQCNSLKQLEFCISKINNESFFVSLGRCSHSGSKIDESDSDDDCEQEACIIADFCTYFTFKTDKAEKLGMCILQLSKLDVYDPIIEVCVPSESPFILNWMKPLLCDDFTSVISLKTLGETAGKGKHFGGIMYESTFDTICEMIAKNKMIACVIGFASGAMADEFKSEIYDQANKIFLVNTSKLVNAIKCTKSLKTIILPPPTGFEHDNEKCRKITHPNFCDVESDYELEKILKQALVTNTSVTSLLISANYGPEFDVSDDYQQIDTEARIGEHLYQKYHQWWPGIKQRNEKG